MRLHRYLLRKIIKTYFKRFVLEKRSLPQQARTKKIYKIPRLISFQEHAALFLAYSSQTACI